MKLNYRPGSELEKFGQKIYNLLVENFPQTFYVGGMVRDLVLHRKVIDIDIATRARPDETAALLKKNGIIFDDSNKKFGSVIVRQGGLAVEITAFRKDQSSRGRYPAVKFINSPRLDSQRRDFTINSLYLSQKSGEIIDFYNGLADIRNKLVRFIGFPRKRLEQDPLRILRALRFCLTLNFKLEAAAKNAIKKDFNLINGLTKSKMEKEVKKIPGGKQRKILQSIIDKPETLDKHLQRL